MLSRRLNKPYFLFRPTQVARRLNLEVRRRRQGGRDLEIGRLPWGLPLAYRREEQIGLCIARRGIFDLTVSEVLYRLTDPGALALDVGANVGHMTSLLAARTGQFGRVVAFEPHPAIRACLEENVRRWDALGAGPVEVRHEALSRLSGEGTLHLEPAFDWNQGSASLRNDAMGRVVKIPVETRRLDDIFDTATVDVMKVDVEGHEREVLLGAENLLGDGRIRDIIFEDFETPPTAVARLLEGYGYAVFSLDQAFHGPVVRPGFVQAAQDSGDDPSYLATLDAKRALSRLKPRGWAALGRGPRVGGATRTSLAAGPSSA